MLLPECRIYCVLNHKKYACFFLTRNHLPHIVEDVLEREKATVISFKDNIVFAKKPTFSKTATVIAIVETMTFPVKNTSYGKLATRGVFYIFF